MTEPVTVPTKPPDFVCTVCEISLSDLAAWKRHESSAHFEIGGWLCWKCIGSSSALHSSRKALQDHCASAHSIEYHEAQLEGHFVGKNWLQSFYCGFCVQIHKQNSTRNDAHDERHEHIASHFRDGITISEWKHIRPLRNVVRDCCRSVRRNSDNIVILPSRSSVFKLPRNSTVFVRTEGKVLEIQVADESTALGLSFIPLLEPYEEL